MTALKTVIVGFGAIARGLAADPLMAQWFPIATHAQAIEASPDFELIGVVDPDASARKAAEIDWRVPAIADIDKAAEKFRPDVLVLAAPPGDRLETLRAFPGVKGVMVEKPLGGGGSGLVRLAADREIPLQVHFWRRGDPTHLELADGGLRARIGQPQAAFGLYGNGLANNGSHLIDAARMLLGEPISAQALAAPAALPNAPIKGDVQLPFALAFPDGFVLSVQPLDFTHYREVGLDIWGTGGRIAFRQESLSVEVFPLAPNRGLKGEMEINTGQGDALPVRVGEALPALYANLCAAIRDDKALISDGANALLTEQVLAAVLASANAGGKPEPI